MFAFAVWDARERELFAARDRIGVKPFFIHAGRVLVRLDAGVVFALRDFPRRLDFLGLARFLAFQVCLAPQTFLADVRQLPPASRLRWRSATSASRWRAGKFRGGAAAGAADRGIGGAGGCGFAQSVRRQLVADVPGAFLPAASIPA
jgi:asparagine synthase (glutamine-hydrolysing)